MGYECSDITTPHQQNQTNSHLVTGIVASPDRTPTLMDKQRYNEYDMIESNKNSNLRFSQTASRAQERMYMQGHEYDLGNSHWNVSHDNHPTKYTDSPVSLRNPDSFGQPVPYANLYRSTSIDQYRNPDNTYTMETRDLDPSLRNDYSELVSALDNRFESTTSTTSLKWSESLAELAQDINA